MGDDGHVVPVAAVFEMFGFDAPCHVVELFDRGTVHRGVQASVVFLGRLGRRHFARTLRQRVIHFLHAGDSEAHTARHRATIGAVGRMIRFETHQTRPQSGLGRIEQIFRVRSAERLHRFVGIADEQQAHATAMQRRKEIEARERGVLEIIDDDEFRQVFLLSLVHGRGRVDHEPRGVETELVRIGVLDGLVVFAAQREGEPPLHA